jgi:hypothetical protein
MCSCRSALSWACAWVHASMARISGNAAVGLLATYGLPWHAAINARARTVSHGQLQGANVRAVVRQVVVGVEPVVQLAAL